MSANAVIPFALNVQKWVHEHNEGPDGKPKKHFTKIPLWWVGIVCMIGGEFFNMLAYGWAPTAIVAPVGAVGVFFNGVHGQCMGSAYACMTHAVPNAMGMSMQWARSVWASAERG